MCVLNVLSGEKVPWNATHHALLLSLGRQAPEIYRENRTPSHKDDNYGYRISVNPP